MQSSRRMMIYQTTSRTSCTPSDKFCKGLLSHHWCIGWMTIHHVQYTPQEQLTSSITMVNTIKDLNCSRRVIDCQELFGMRETFKWLLVTSSRLINWKLEQTLNDYLLKDVNYRYVEWNRLASHPSTHIFWTWHTTRYFLRRLRVCHAGYDYKFRR